MIEKYLSSYQLWILCESVFISFYWINGFHDIFILKPQCNDDNLQANYMHTFVWHRLLNTQISIGLMMSSYKHEPLPLLQYLICDQSCMFLHIETWYSMCFKIQVDGIHALLEPKKYFPYLVFQASSLVPQRWVCPLTYEEYGWPHVGWSP